MRHWLPSFLTAGWILPELAQLHSPSSLSNVSDESSEVSRAPAFATVFAPVASSVKAARNASSLQKRDGFVNAAHPASQDVAVSTTNQPSTAKTLEGLTATSKNMNRRNCIRNQARSCTQAMNSASSCSMAGATYARRCCSTSQTVAESAEFERSGETRETVFSCFQIAISRRGNTKPITARFATVATTQRPKTQPGDLPPLAYALGAAFQHFQAAFQLLKSLASLGTMVALALLGKHKT